jgi:hypothetical protein
VCVRERERERKREREREREREHARRRARERERVRMHVSHRTDEKLENRLRFGVCERQSLASDQKQKVI